MSGKPGMPRWMVERRLASSSSWASFCRAAARLTFRPSASPSQPSRSASSMRAWRLSHRPASRGRWAGARALPRRAGAGRSRDVGGIPGAVPGRRCHGRERLRRSGHRQPVRRQPAGGARNPRQGDLYLFRVRLRRPEHPGGRRGRRIGSFRAVLGCSIVLAGLCVFSAALGAGAAGRLSTELGDTERAPARLPSKNARHPDAARPLALSSRSRGPNDDRRPDTTAADPQHDPGSPRPAPLVAVPYPPGPRARHCSSTPSASSAAASGRATPPV